MLPPKVRHRIEFAYREAAIAALGDFGNLVGPRTGPNRRNQNQKDDFCIRQMMLGFLASTTLPLPSIVEMLEPDPEGAWPDALLLWPDGSRSGLEVTEATSKDYQRLLTREEHIANELPDDEIAVFETSVDGYAGAPTDVIARLVAEAIARKGQPRHAGTKYAGVPVCDLLIYENSDGGLFIESKSNEDVSKVIHNLHFGTHRHAAHVANTFRFVHLLVGQFFVHSVLGSSRICRLPQGEKVSELMS